MSLSEAIEAVGRMIRGYANRGTADRGYIGAIAELLCQYPRSLAVECADPVRGVVLTTKFMPTPADISGWMEPRVKQMQNRYNFEDGAERQLRERREYNAKMGRAPEGPRKHNRYNLLVRPDRPGYAQMCERAKTADPLDYCHDEQGIWVPFYWYDERNSWNIASKYLTLDQVREKYGAEKVDAVPDAADDGWKKLKSTFGSTP